MLFRQAGIFHTNYGADRALFPIPADRWMIGILLLLALPVLMLKLAAGGAALALLETTSAKMRIFRVPEFLATAFLLAVIGLLVHILLGV